MTVVRHTCDPLEKYNVCHKARPFPHGYNSGSAERAHSCGIEALQPHRLQDYVRRSTALRGADMGAWLLVEVAAGHERDGLHVSFHQGPASPPHWTGQCMEEHAGHAMKHYEDKNNAAYMTQIMEYLYAHHMDIRIPDNRLDQHTGHPGFADYIRDELLHA